MCLVVTLVGCVAYTARPIDAQQTRKALDARTLADPRLAKRLAELLPAETAARAAAGTWEQAPLLIAASQFNPTLAEARAHVGEAVAAVRTARTLPNPTLNLASEYDLSRAAESPWLWGVTTDFLFDSTLRRRLRVELSQAGVRDARLAYAEAIWAVRRELRAALLTDIIAQKRIARLEEAERQRSRLSELMNERVRAGEAAATERVQLDLELARTRTGLAEARRQFNDAQVRLAAVIGIPLAALDGQLMQWEALEAPEPPSGSRIAQLREQALLSRPDLERAIGEYRSREIELQQQVRAQYPQVSLGPGYTYDHGIRKATLGVSLAVPLFNRNQGPIAEADMRREAAGSHLLSVQAQILSEVDGAAQAYRGALAALQLARQQSLSAQALADASARSLAAGAEDRPTLLALRLNANAEQLAELDVLERAQQALGQLEDALRTPLAGNDFALRLAPDPVEH